MNPLIALLDIIGIVAFSASGALVAGRAQMDWFGALVLAFVTGIGGGTARDFILDVPVFWLDQPHYLWACLAGVMLVWLMRSRFVNTTMYAIKICDALGLAMFTVLGAQKTLTLGHNEAVALIMGILTGCGGGIMRDVLANQMPFVLARKTLYATASLIGGLGVVLLAPFSLSMAMIAGFLLVLVTRILAERYQWRLPLFTIKE